ncbi:MAG: hypothetical protein K8R21_10070, partial [Leptospira sp.]|nr:hypothetical protein [Leptospira sp.]
MNVLLIFLSVFIASGSVFAKEIILTGEIAEAGRLLKTKDKLYTFKQSELSQEISELSGKKIRALCEIENATCKLLRYEIAPFTDETGLAPWTLKQIPKYVSKKISSFNPKVTPDGNLLFWTALIERGRSSTQKIWFSSTDENGFWKAGQQMAEPLNNQAPSAVISALPGGNELFVFGSYSEDEMIRDLETEMNKENHRLAATSKSEREYKLRYADLQKLFQRRLDKIYNRVPLYKTSRTGTNWLQPNPIKFPDFYNLYKKPENPTQQVFGGSALSANGRVLIYSAMHNNTAGKLDLYVSIADKSGIFPVGRSIGRMVNTQEEEMAPFLASDDRTLYFSSTGFNGLSIYFTQRIGDGWDNWTSPIEISQNLHGVNFFTIPASGNWAYISRNGNLMMTYIPLEFRP